MNQIAKKSVYVSYNFLFYFRGAWKSAKVMYTFPEEHTVSIKIKAVQCVHNLANFLDVQPP